MNHCVAQDDTICIKLQSSHFPRSLLSEFGITFFLHEMQPIELFICRNPMILQLTVDATMLANSALTSTNRPFLPRRHKAVTWSVLGKQTREVQ